jgi:hypothetical protein
MNLDPHGIWANVDNRKARRSAFGLRAALPAQKWSKECSREGGNRRPVVVRRSGADSEEQQPTTKKNEKLHHEHNHHKDDDGQRRFLHIAGVAPIRHALRNSMQQPAVKD